jgi:hypothetical protein
VPEKIAAVGVLGGVWRHHHGNPEIRVGHDRGLGRVDHGLARGIDPRQKERPFDDVVGVLDEDERLAEARVG